MALLLVPQAMLAQATVGGTTPDPSAVLDMQSTDKGFLWPRLGTTERNAIVNPARGLVIFNTGTLCLEINQGTPSAPQWERVKCRTGAIGGLDCGAVSVSGPVITVPYTGGNGGVYASQSASSAGVTGLSATLPAGNYANGTGSVLWTVSGTPAALGPASFSLSMGGFTCSVPFMVVAGTLTGLDCADKVLTGSLSSGQAASGVSASVPYTGGDGGFYGAQTASSTGVTGLTATLDGGFFAIGTGNLTFVITGTPASGGTASFALNIGGQTCTLNVPVAYVCRAKVNNSVYRNFLCHNLGAANTSADPFTPGWEINGGYWQWGRKDEAAAGPTATDPKAGAVIGWNMTNAPDGSWADGSKMPDDPCPTGFRVPTEAQWNGVIANNTKTNVGNFSSSATNYSAGVKFGDQLMLPAAGRRLTNGQLYERGGGGIYWSSKGGGSNTARYLYFSNSNAFMGGLERNHGLSVRCVEEIPGSIGAINCSGNTVNGALTPGQAASGVSASVPYTGGNGEPHSGQTVSSNGVTGLTATLSAGSFASGAGNLSYAITGTPASGGTASFALNIGGQTCTLDVQVTSGPVCQAKVSPSVTMNFMCHNLGAANDSADPFTPSWEINGGYWQWGVKDQAAAGPTGPDISQANDGPVNGWNTTAAPNSSWADGTKTANDPCPPGFRVPTVAQWDGVIANNTKTDVGSFTSSATNYGAGKKFGDQLMLPVAGLRNSVNGALDVRGYIGYYWSSTGGIDEEIPFLLAFTSGNTAIIGSFEHATGVSVRCIAE